MLTSTSVSYWRHSYPNILKLSVSYRNTLQCLINVPRYTSSSLSFAMNVTDHINVVFRIFAYSLMRRVTAIVNSDSYLQSSLMNK